MSKKYFHYVDIPLSTIDNLINLEADMRVTERGASRSGMGYKKLSSDGYPLEEFSRCKMGHTGLSMFSEDEQNTVMRFLDEILEPIIGYAPHTHGRFGYYKQPIHIHNDGENYISEEWKTHNITGKKPRPANTTVFFPLRCYKEDGSTGTTETVYFHQRTPWSGKSGVEPENDDEKFYRKHGAFGWRPDHDYSDLDGYTNEPFDIDIWGKHLKQHPIEMLHGFSFLESVPWNIGEVVMFETSRIHCSSYMEDCFGKDCFLVKVNTDLWN